MDETVKDMAALNREVQAVWDANAQAWDARITEGNSFQLQLVNPATERLLALKPGERVLEIACGNGNFSRRMARQGVYVLATDFSPRMIEVAQVKTTEHQDRIEYRMVDATDEAQLLSLGVGQYDAAVCNMAIMDMAEIEPLFSAMSKLLKPHGRFVFSVMHPCFNSGSRMIVEQNEVGGELVTTYAVVVSRYLDTTPFKGLAIREQPVPQYYFPRPVHVLFNAAFQAGFALDGLEESAFNVEKGDERPNWLNFREIPPVLVARVRLPR